MSIHRVLQHRARAVVALLALAVAALALTACGGGGSSSGADAQTLLKQTFTGTHKIKSGKAKLQIAVDVQGSTSVQGPIKVAIGGPFQSEGSGKLPQFDLALDASLGGQGSFQAGLTSAGGRVFVNVGGTSYEAPSTLVDKIEQSMKQSSGKPTFDLGGLGIDPLGWLTDPTVTGTETIGGAETQHITAQLNVSALLDDVNKLLAKVSKQGVPGTPAGRIPSAIPDSARKQIEDAVKHGSIDVWTGTSDKTLRKVSLALTIEPKNPGSGPKSANVTLSLELQDLNQPQTIKAPASSRPLSELLGSLQSLLGGALGGGAGGLGGSGGASGGSSSQQQLDKYSQCLQAAGSNVAKAQQCASLLTK